MSALLALLIATPLAGAQGQDDALILIAHPAFRDLEYRQTVLIAAPAPNGGHVGVILNRPTRRSLGSLFPEHEPSKKVHRPGVLRRPVLARRAGGAGARRQHPRQRLGAADEEPLPRVPRQYHRPGHRGHAERGALFRRLRRLAPGRAARRDRPRPVVGGRTPTWTSSSARTPKASGKSCCSSPSAFAHCPICRFRPTSRIALR